MKQEIVIDGSQGEGGGQILRSSLCLSLVTGTPIRIENIRAKRRKPGLLRQHLTAVRAAKEVGRARTSGDELGSRTVSFAPSGVHTGDYHFAVGTAGSSTLVLQTVLPALLTASAPSTVTLEGGTHNPQAPPFDFLERAYLPLIERMGPTLRVELERRGFYPAGGGRWTVSIQPSDGLSPLILEERGELLEKKATAIVSSLPARIGARELERLGERMELKRKDGVVVEEENPNGPGNALAVELVSEHVTEVFVGFGMVGVAAERVADQTAREATRYLGANVPVGPHLADQLLLPMALAGGGSYRTLKPSMHTLTNIEVIRQFLDIPIHCDRTGRDESRVTLGTEVRTQ